MSSTTIQQQPQQENCCHHHHHDHLFSIDSLTIIASFLQVSDWFAMSAVSSCWNQAIHFRMKNEWRRVYEQDWMLNKIIGQVETFRDRQFIKQRDDDPDLILNSNNNICDDQNEDQNIDSTSDENYAHHMGVNIHDEESEEVDWMRAIQHQLRRLPIKIESVERGECLDFYLDKNKRMEWDSPILNQRRRRLRQGKEDPNKNSFSIFQFSFNILETLQQNSIETENCLNNEKTQEEQIRSELFKQYRICLFLDYLSLGLRPSLVNDVVCVWEDVYDREPILTLPLVSFLLVLLSDDPIKLMEDLILEEYGEVCNWIYIGLSQCPQNRIGFSFVVDELNVTKFSSDHNGNFPWFHKTEIVDKNFPLYLGFSRHLYNDDDDFESQMDDCTFYHLNISCELLETHHVKLNREETVESYYN